MDIVHNVMEALIEKCLRIRRELLSSYECSAVLLVGRRGKNENTTIGGLQKPLLWVAYYASNCMDIITYRTNFFRLITHSLGF